MQARREPEPSGEQQQVEVQSRKQRASVCSGSHLLEQRRRPHEATQDQLLGAAKCTAGVQEQPRNWWRRARIRVALLGLSIAVVNCYAQATFCIAIVEMVLPADYKQAQTSDLRAPALSQEANDESCPVEAKYRHFYDGWRFPAGAQNGSSPEPVAPSSQTIDVSQRFGWDASRQGLLLGAFAFGTAPLQVVGGRLAEMHGAKWVLLAGCIGTALTNLSIPPLAHLSFPLLLLNRFLMGVAQAGMEPGLMCLLAEWLTPSEAGFFISMLLFAICVGFFLGSLLSSFILASGLGWPLAFYVSGGLNLAVALAWFWFADSWPRASRHILAGELAHIEREQARPGLLEAGAASAAVVCGELAASKEQEQEEEREAQLAELKLASQPQEADCSGPAKEGEQESSRQAFGAPWASILGTRSVWAFIVCKISIRWCADVLSNELPTYLANVLHLSIEINGILNSVSSALFAICSFLTGWLVNELGARQDRRAKARGGPTDKTKLRKIFQSSASFGSALAVFLMSRYDCDLLFSTTMLLLLSCCLVMGTGGELQIPYDMSARYPGTLHGMACTLSVSGWLAPPLIGLILGDKPSSRQRWQTVWYLTASINLVGGLVFLLFADASPRDFDQAKRRRPQSGGSRPPEPAGYANAACTPGSTRNNSPKLPKLLGHQEAEPNSLSFDGAPLKVRQSSESFVAPGSYPNHASFSQWANLEPMFPFREKPKGQKEPRGQRVGLVSRILRLVRLSRADQVPQQQSDNAHPADDTMQDTPSSATKRRVQDANTITHL